MHSLSYGGCMQGLGKDSWGVVCDVFGWWYCLMVVANCWSGVAVPLYTMSDL